jgi:integrase
MLEAPGMGASGYLYRTSVLEVVQKVLQKRGQILYIRWIVPADLRSLLGCTALVKSLYTRDKFLALERAKPYMWCIDQLKKLRIARRMTEITEETFQRLVAEVWREAQHKSIEAVGSPQEAVERQSDARLMIGRSKGALRGDEWGAHDRQGITTGFRTELLEDYRQQANYLLFPDHTVDGEWVGYKASGKLAEYEERLASTIREATELYQQRVRDSFDLDADVRPPSTNFTSPPQQKKVAGEDVSAAPLFSEVYIQFLEKKVSSGLKDKVQESYCRYYSDWKALMEDRPIDRYKKTEVRDFILKIASLPKRNLKLYKGLEVNDLLEMDIPDGHRIKPKTAKEVQKWLQGIYSHASNEELVNESPANDLKLGLDGSKPFSSYSDTEIRLMCTTVSSAPNDWQKWLVWVAAYTGMRLSEIVQLRKADIKLDEDSCRYYIRVTDEGEGQSVKSEAGNRQVPIHQYLIDQGFMALVESSTDRLFPNLKSKAVTRWFSDTFRPACGIGAFNDLEQRKVFHSFRHTLITKALSKNQTINVQQVVGHEKQNMGTTSRYLHAQPLKEVLNVIDCITYT